MEVMNIVLEAFREVNTTYYPYSTLPTGVHTTPWIYKINGVIVHPNMYFTIISILKNISELDE